MEGLGCNDVVHRRVRLLSTESRAGQAAMPHAENAIIPLQCIVHSAGMCTRFTMPAKFLIPRQYRRTGVYTLAFEQCRGVVAFSACLCACHVACPGAGGQARAGGLQAHWLMNSILL